MMSSMLPRCQQCTRTKTREERTEILQLWYGTRSKEWNSHPTELLIRFEVE